MFFLLLLIQKNIKETLIFSIDYCSIAFEIKSILKSHTFYNKIPLSEHFSLTYFINSDKQAE